MRAEALAIVFEIESTLIDSRAAQIESAERCLAEHGLARPADDEIEGLIDGGPRALMLGLLARRMLADPGIVGRVQAEALLSGFERHCCSLCHRGTRARFGAAESLRQLARAGFRLACLSEHDAAHAQCLLRHNGIASSFTLVAGRDSQTFASGDARLMRHLCRRLGVAPQAAIHVGSRSADREAARAAGLRAWAVSHGRADEAGRGADRPQRLFADLPALADRLLQETVVAA